jgi:hypothetical protein
LDRVFSSTKFGIFSHSLKMAQYRAIIEGNRGEASRLGSKDSGISALINGWNNGIYVCGSYDEDLKQDVFQVYRTYGSNKNKSDELLMTVYQDGTTEINKVIQK